MSGQRLPLGQVHLLLQRQLPDLAPRSRQALIPMHENLDVCEHTVRQYADPLTFTT
jgi:hypothetical protein